tara:strand:- start:348 stop:560 length:213 start_codon:yes stop_codon:yes gene_type:complete
MDEFFEKLKNDETGKLSDIAKELFYLAQEAGKLNIQINEIASVCTMGWQSSNSEEITKIFEYMLESVKKY